MSELIDRLKLASASHWTACEALQLSWNEMAAKCDELTVQLENLREDNLVLQARNRTMRAQIQNLQDEVEELELSLIVEVVSTD